MAARIVARWSSFRVAIFERDPNGDQVMCSSRSHEPGVNMIRLGTSLCEVQRIAERPSSPEQRRKNWNNSRIESEVASRFLF